MGEKYLYGKVYIQHLSNYLSVSGKECIRVCLDSCPPQSSQLLFPYLVKKTPRGAEQALAELGVSAALPGDELAESSSEGPIEEH